MKTASSQPADRLFGPTLAAALAAAFVVSGAVPAFADRSSLVEDSPFIWEGYTPPEERRPPPREEPPAPPQDDPLDRLELRGITVIGGETLVSLYHPDDQESFWLSVDESEAGYTVLDYDGSDSIRVRRGDTERSITLKESRVAEMPRSQEQARQGSSGRQESAQETEERLRQAAEELRRRRAIRRSPDSGG